MKRSSLLAASACTLLAALFSGSCAKTPDVPLGDSKRLVVRLRVRGQIHPQDSVVPYYYFVVMNRTADSTGPAPVARIGQPWGNGFVASSQNTQIGYIGTVVFKSDRSLGLSGYQLYEVQTSSSDPDQPVGNPDEFGTFPAGWVALGQPEVVTTPQTGDRELSFALDLSRLPRNSLTAYPYLQLNFIATDNLPAGADTNVPKDWDALGDSRSSPNRYLTIDLRSNTIYRPNVGTAPEEPEGDVRDKDGPVVDLADLDIDDYSVEIQSQQ